MKEKTALSPRKRPKQGRSKETFAAIVEAAARVLAMDGYERANTNRIARVAGVGIGSLYDFFPNKDAILAEARSSLEDRLSSVTASIVDSCESLPVEDTIRKCAKTIIDAHASTSEGEHALLGCVPDSIVDRNSLLEELGRLTTDFATRHRKQVRRRNVELAAFVALHAADAVTREARRRFPETLHSGELLDEITDLLTRYLVEAPAGPHARS